MAGGKIVELNNGEKLEVGYFGGSRAKLLLNILENVKERLSYIPNLEDAKRIPDMPKDMGLYNRYFGSYEKACKELVRREERKSRWRKMTDEEKAYLKEIESREKVSHYGERYLEQNHSKERGDNMKKKPQVTPEKRKELLGMVIEEYHFNGDVMPTARQLKKSHLFKLYELWSAFGSYDDLCKVVEKELGGITRPEKIVKKARDNKVKLMQPVVEQEQEKEKEVKGMQEKEMSKNMAEGVQELVQEVNVAAEVAGDVEEKKEIIRQDEPLSKKKKRNVKVWRCTKEEVITELKRFYEETGKLPTISILKKRKDAGEDWLAYETLIRHLGPKEGWMQYLDGAEAVKSEEDNLEVTEEGTEKSLPTAEVLEVEDEMKAMNISLKISLKVPGMNEPFELEFDLSSK